MNYYHRKDCRLCFSHRLTCVFPMKPSVLADAFVASLQRGTVQEKYPMDLYLCLDCGHVQLLDVVSPDLLYRNYLYETSTSLGLVAHFQELACELVTRFNLHKGSLVLDIGSNDGSLLAAFQSFGVKTLGVDPAQSVANRATQRGLTTIVDFFTYQMSKECRKRHGPVDLITANNVFAHADDLSDMLKGVREWISSEGIFVFEVSYLPDIFERGLFDTIYHEHLCYHSLNPLREFLARGGFELFDVKRIATKGGSIRVFAQPFGAGRNVGAEVERLCFREKSEGWHQPDKFEPFVKLFESQRQELIEELVKLKSQEKQILGYGASHTVTTLLNQWEIGPFFSGLVDDNIRKQGRYSPGDQLPVFSPEVLYERKGVVVVILAWQYAEAIAKRHQRFLDEGGLFIVPLPRLNRINARDNCELSQSVEQSKSFNLLSLQ